MPAISRERRQRAETQSRASRELHAAQRIDALQVDDARRRDDAFLDEIEQVHAAGFGERRAASIRGQQRHGFFDGLRVDPLEAVHGCSSSARRAASTFAGFIGNVRMRLPVAL